MRWYTRWNPTKGVPVSATDAQVRIVLRERAKGRTQEQAAVRANLRSRKTVAKYERLGELPSALRQPRTYRTREDPFAADWPSLGAQLERAPELEAKTLFDWLCERAPGKYREGQLRTLQRRIRLWRAEHQAQLLTLPQRRRPGEALQTDGVKLDHLGVTIAGQPFPHLLLHSVLPYSNWEWGRVVQSESLLALRLGVQSALVRLGHVPAAHQTDNTTAATHRLGVAERGRAAGERGFNAEYLAFCRHFGMAPRTIHLGNPNENGDIEAANGALQAALEQQLLLRGSREFASPGAYEEFVFAVMDKRNRLRRERLAEELAAMPALTAAPLPEYREYGVRVGEDGLIRVLAHTYSVPSGLKGKLVGVRAYEWELEVWFAGKRFARLERLTERNAHRIDYRHVIDSLLRKPGGFRRYRYREDLFPTAVFRRAWEWLCAHKSERQADLAYLRVLKLAATTLETAVGRALADLLDGGAAWDDRTVAARVRPEPGPAPAVPRVAVDLREYDRLLGAEGRDDAA